MAKEIRESVEEIKKLIKAGNFILGYSVTLKSIDKIETVYLASNCKPEFVEELTQRAKLTDLNIIEVPLTNVELGRVFKKPFSISVLASLKNGSN